MCQLQYYVKTKLIASSYSYFLPQGAMGLRNIEIPCIMKHNSSEYKNLKRYPVSPWQQHFYRDMIEM